LIGSKVSHYEVLERLGRGGAGLVYKARDLRLDRLVALKFLNPRRGLSEEDRKRFVREARVASSLDHPNVCALYEIGESEKGEMFLAMALCPGETLKDRLWHGPLPLGQAVDIAVQIADGLAAAHQRGIIHRDIKPANVMISPEGRVKVVDFGLAKLADAGTRLTREGVLLGTTPYMSPEQLRGAPLDPRTDIWSLGVVFYEMLTGKNPFEGASEGELVHAILQESPVPLAERLPGAPASVQRIVQRALAKNPEARYARIEEIRADLRALPVDSFPGGDSAGDNPTRREIGGREPSSGPAVLTGQTVSHFRIAEPLGGGGMGVVYRAEDMQLGRSVALKFLAPELVRDADAKARFLTEARAASALDHPNLCTILEVGESEEGLLFLAMPRYDGESLERRIARGPLPIEQALDVATQTARGLAKAHKHGIVHRDVKPANLFLTNDGVVKILDFGIAKLSGQAGPTRRGASLGTPAYMAPEQTRGDEVDARADVWSLGVVLYEMLTGRRPFLGGSDAALVYAVLHEEPEPPSRLRPEVTPEIERIVSRMLAKDPGRRYPDAVDVLADLRRESGLPVTGSRTAQVTAPHRRWIALTALLVLALVAAGGVLGLFVWSRWSRGLKAPLPQSAQVRRLTDLQGRETFPSLSPDGTFFVYAKAAGGKTDLFLQRVAGGSPIDLTAGSGADDTQPAFSPDGQQIAFRSERDGGGVFLMGATGESVKRLTDFGFNPAWSPDGREIAVATEGAVDPGARFSRSQIYRVDVATGARSSLGVGDGVQPSWSPHGLRIAFWGLSQPGARRAIWTVPANGGAAVPVVDDAFYNWCPVWSPDGKFLYFASNRGGSMNLWRVPLDEETGRVLDAPQPITTPSEWSAQPSLSRDGRLLLYATNDSRSYVERVPLDAQKGRTAGAPAQIYQGSRSIWSCQISPDGSAAVLRSASPQEDLFLIRSDGSDLRQLTNDLARDRSPSWSPDGRRILFSSNRSGKYEAWTIRPDGSDLKQVTSLPDQPVLNPFWSSDGRQIGFTYGSQGTALLDLAAPGARPHLLPKAPGGEAFAGVSWSADGRFLAGVLLRQDESPVPGIVLWSLADNTARRLTETGNNPSFLANGRQILFSDRDNTLRLIDVAGGEVKTLLPPPQHTSYVSASVGPGDRTLCTVRKGDEGDIWILSLLDGMGRS
jgi:eukaryotic-like serine/threonine-protein kinase